MNLNANCSTCRRGEKCSPYALSYAHMVRPLHPSVLVVTPGIEDGEATSMQVGQSDAHRLFRDGLKLQGWDEREIEETFAFVPAVRCRTPELPTTRQKRLCADWLKADIIATRIKLVVFLDYSIWAHIGSARTKKTVIGRCLPLEQIEYHQRVDKKVVRIDTPGLHVLTLQDPNKVIEQSNPKSPEPFEEWHHNLTKIRRFLDGNYPVDPFAGKKYELVRTPERAVQLFDWYAQQEEVAWDIEAAPQHAALDPFHDDYRVTLLTLCAKAGHATAIPLMHREAPLWDDPRVREAFVRWATSPQKKVAHNGHQYDCIGVYQKLGVWVDITWDSLVADACINENREHTLKYLADIYTDLGHYEDELEAVFKAAKIGKKKRDYELHVSLETLARYGCADADATYQLKQAQAKIMATIPSPGHGSQLDFYEGYQHGHSRSAAMTTLTGMAVDPVNVDIARRIVEEPYQEIRDFLSSAATTEQFRQVKAAHLTGEGKFLVHDDRVYHNYDAYRTGQPWVDVAQGVEFAPGGFEALRAAGAMQKRSFKMVQANIFTPQDLEPNWIGGPDVGILAQKILKLPVEKTAAGNVVTRAEVLKQLEHPLIDKILHLRSLHKQRNTYILPVCNGPYTISTDSGRVETRVGWIKDDGLIHPRILLAGSDRGGGDTDTEGGAATGRISIKDPAAQTFAKRTEFGKRIYSMFTSRYANPRRPFAVDQDHADKLWAFWYETKPREWLAQVEGFVFPGQEGGGAIIQADYSQVELRLFAIAINCQWMLEQYARGADLHLEAAMEFFQVSREEALANGGFLRSAAKSFWFGPIYGETAAGMTADLRKKGVPGNGPDGLITEAETEAILDRMMARMPEFQEYKDRLFHFIDQSHCLYTGAGRRRYLPQWTSPDGRTRSKARRQAVNTTIQSLGADCTNWSWKTINLHLEEGGWQSPDRIIVSVHDSVVGDTISCRVPAFSAFIMNTMGNVPWDMVRRAPIALAVDVEAGPTWGELAAYKIEVTKELLAA